MKQFLSKRYKDFLRSESRCRIIFFEAASVEITVDVEPEFDLPTKEYELTIEPTDVSDEEITKELMQLENSEQADVVERAVQNGDYVKCSYEGMLEGKAVADLVPEKPMYGKQANTWEEAGNQTGMGVDAIADGVIGMSVGDKATTFAKDLEVSLANKSVSYQLEVHEAREKKHPLSTTKNF